MLKQILLIALLSIFLVGCGTFEKKEVIVYKTNTVVIDVPDYLFEPISVERPPTKDYINKTMEEKENLLVDYSISLMKSLIKYKTRLDSIKAHIEKEKENYKEK